MPKNDQYQVRKPRDEEKKKIHPVWRGIGCVLMVFIPILSYVAATQIINKHDRLSWVIIPEEIVVSTYSDPLIFVKIVYAAAIALILFLLMGIVTFLTNKYFGPSKYGPYDVRK
jgi:hypothetical protein